MSARGAPGASRNGIRTFDTLRFLIGRERALLSVLPHLGPGAELVNFHATEHIRSLNAITPVQRRKHYMRRELWIKAILTNGTSDG